MRLLILPSGSRRVPSARQRAFALAEPLRARGWDVRVLDPDRVAQAGFFLERHYRFAALRRAVAADTVIVQKRLLGPGTLRIVRALARTIIYDWDDALHINRRTDRPAPAATLARLHAVCAAADLVIAGNDELARYASRYARRVVVLPTGVDARAGAAARQPDGPPVLGWIGTAQNYSSLETVLPAIEEVVAAAPDTVFRVVSSERPPWRSPRTEFVRWTLDGADEALRSFSVGLMPLEDTAWNRGKCGFKALQYMNAGIPAVVSPVGMLRDLDPRSGVTLASTKSEWVRALGDLVSDPAERCALGERGRQFVASQFDIDVIADRLDAELRLVTRTGR